MLQHRGEAMTTPATPGTEAAVGLRLLAFCDYYGGGASGGSERVARAVYSRLAAWGASVTLVSPAPGVAAGSVDDDGVRVISVPARDLSHVVGAQVAIARGVATAARDAYRETKPIVLHTNSLHFQSSVVAARLQGRVGIPLVTTAHIGSLEHLPRRARWATGAYERTIGRYILRHSERAIAVSEPVAEHLGSLGYPRRQIDVVRNGVDHATFHPPTEPRAQLATGPHIAFVGRLIANKGPDLVVDALAALRRDAQPFTASFIGDGPLSSEMQRRVTDAGLDHVVEFTGEVTDVADRLRRADILVRPSYTEGLPLAVIEAMASGVCVIASKVPGNMCLIEDHVSGLLFPVGDAHALGASLRLAVTDANLRVRLAQEGRARSQAYSWDATAAGTLAVLASAAARAARDGSAR
jgi:glycosyltransferase involved in cell wall biosynthesis